MLPKDHRLRQVQRWVHQDILPAPSDPYVAVSCAADGEDSPHEVGTSFGDALHDTFPRHGDHKAAGEDTHLAFRILRGTGVALRVVEVPDKGLLGLGVVVHPCNLDEVVDDRPLEAVVDEEDECAVAWA